MSSVFWRFSDEPMAEDDSMFAKGENESLFKVWKRRIWLENFTPTAAELLELLPSNFELILMPTFIFEHKKPKHNVWILLKMAFQNIRLEWDLEANISSNNSWNITWCCLLSLQSILSNFRSIYLTVLVRV